MEDDKEKKNYSLNKFSLEEFNTLQRCLESFQLKQSKENNILKSIQRKLTVDQKQEKSNSIKKNNMLFKEIKFDEEEARLIVKVMKLYANCNCYLNSYNCSIDFQSENIQIVSSYNENKFQKINIKEISNFEHKQKIEKNKLTIKPKKESNDEIISENKQDNISGSNYFSPTERNIKEMLIDLKQYKTNYQIMQNFYEEKIAKRKKHYLNLQEKLKLLCFCIEKVDAQIEQLKEKNKELLELRLKQYSNLKLILPEIEEKWQCVRLFVTNFISPNMGVKKEEKNKNEKIGSKFFIEIPEKKKIIEVYMKSSLKVSQNHQYFQNWQNISMMHSKLKIKYNQFHNEAHKILTQLEDKINQLLFDIDKQNIRFRKNVMEREYCAQKNQLIKWSVYFVNENIKENEFDQESNSEKNFLKLLAELPILDRKSMEKIEDIILLARKYNADEYCLNLLKEMRILDEKFIDKIKNFFEKENNSSFIFNKNIKGKFYILEKKEDWFYLFFITHQLLIGKYDLNKNLFVKNYLKLLRKMQIYVNDEFVNKIENLIKDETGFFLIYKINEIISELDCCKPKALFENCRAFLDHFMNAIALLTECTDDISFIRKIDEHAMIMKKAFFNFSLNAQQLNFNAKEDKKIDKEDKKEQQANACKLF